MNEAMSRIADLIKVVVAGFFAILFYRYLTQNRNELIDVPPAEPFVYVEPVLPSFTDLSEADRVSLSEYAINHLYQNISNDNFMEQAHRARLMRSLGEKGSLRHFLEHQLYDWLGMSLEALRSTWNHPRGIVMTTGSAYLKFAVHAIQTIRYLNCSLPMEVFYAGNDDLNEGERELLNSYPGVRCVNLQNHLNLTELKLETWDVKPFALLLSSFQEAILMDADTVFVQDPQLLFQESLYQSTGSLFFRDRTLFGGSWDKPRWLVDMMPAPLMPQIRRSRFFLAQSLYEQEAGVVVLDKRSHMVGLLTACRLNLPGAKDPIRWHTHGEKETFWLGLSMAGEPYGMNPQPAGAVGVPVASAEGGTEEICGHLAHFDERGMLFWFNDGIVQDKRQAGQDLLPGAFTHWAQEGSWSPFMCAIGNMTELSDAERRRLSEIVDLFQPHPTKYNSK